MMQVAVLNGVVLHFCLKPGTGTPIVFLNSLGTDFRIWDEVIAKLDLNVPILCIDKRGHGLSDDGPISMKILVRDVTALMDYLKMPPALICGVSVGGMIAQGLAAERPELVAGMILCCTGAQIGDADGWNARIGAVRSDGIATIAGTILQRWFSESFFRNRSEQLAAYRNMLIRTSTDGYSSVCAAIRDTDFTEQSRNIAVPTHCIAGSEDRATPPAVVRGLARLISGSTFELIDDCGHLPCIEAPDRISAAIVQIHARLK